MTTEYSYEELMALFAAIRAGTAASTNGHTPESSGGYVDWAELWAGADDEADWLIEPVIPAARSVALFAPGGHGKSLLALWLAAAAATGAAVFGMARPAVDVLYLDYEMTRADLRERLAAMGYGPDDDLSRLHYMVLPSIAPLDRELGGNEVVARAAAVDAKLVMIDTFGRAVAGDENEAETVQAWYRWTGLRLKEAGRAFCRLDHAGKDIDRGQRGSSAKNDDVDIVWQMVRLDDDRYRLVARKRRMEWVPETVELAQRGGPDDDVDLSYAMALGAAGYPTGTAAIVKLLDELAVPLEWGRPKVSELLKSKGQGARNVTLGAAIRFRKGRPEVLKTVPGQVFSEVVSDVAGTAGTVPESALVNGTGQGSGTGGDRGAQDKGPGGCVPVRDTLAHPQALSPDGSPWPGMFDDVPDEL